MNRFVTVIGLAAGIVVSNPAICQTKSSVDSLIEGFRNPPPSARMRMFWRVFGPAWEKAEIDYQFDLMKQAGIGGVMTSFFYPVALDSEAGRVHNQTLGSAEFLDTFKFAVERAKEKELRFSVFGGSGWPFGGPTVTPKDAAQRIRRVMVRRDASGSTWTLPKLPEDERIVAAFSGNTDQLKTLKTVYAGAKINASVPGDLQVFIAGPTGMKVKRPALGGEGLVVDHYSRPAALRYLDSVVSPMLKAAPGLLDTVFCDSLEVYNANWTHDFPEQFRKRRGYDIVAKLPVLFDDKNAESPDVRFDFWRTLAELTEERFTKTTGEWARKHGTKLEMEAYGTPPNPLTAARYIDVPAGEQYEWKGFSMSRMAASGAHLAGRRIISAEAWTWLGIPNRLADSLQDMKLASDIHFLAGCNDLMGVDFPYSPRNVPPPGWQPYYGPTMNQNNPQWPYFHALVEYVNRCQWMLRQGRSVADVAIYLPVEDSFAHGPVEQMLLDFHLRDHLVSGEKTGEFGLATSMKHHSDLIHTLLTNGFNYDGIDFWSLNRLAKVRNGKLICGDGEYSIVILPDVKSIDARAFDKLAEFVRQGGVLLITGQIPVRKFDWQDKPANGFSSVTGDMDSNEALSWSILRNYKVYCISNLQSELSSVLSALHPDITMEPKQEDVSFVHRKSENQEIYFFANLSSSPRHFWVDLAPNRSFSKHFHALLMDPITGRITQKWYVDKVHSRPSQVHIELPAHGSTFVMATPERLDPGIPADTAAMRTPGTTLKFRPAWELGFRGPNAAPTGYLYNLVSWTNWKDTKYFSGKGTYYSFFFWNGSLPKECSLRFESVHEAGEVWINGKSAGVVWMPPYEVEIGPLLRLGENSILVTVGNLPVNQFLGLPNEDLRALRAAYGNRFPDPQEKQVMKEPAPSGLIGDVTITVRNAPQLFGNWLIR